VNGRPTEAPGPALGGRADDRVTDAAIGRLGMRLFLASLGMLFGAGLLGHLVIRLRQPTWPPEGAPALPAGLWVSTALLVVTSVAVWRAERAARDDRPRGVRGWLLVTLLLGFGFLAMQVVNWRTMAVAVEVSGQDLFTFTYWMLTVLHGLHVVGGLVPLVVASVRAGTGRYGSLNTVPIHNIAVYWHFLGVTWAAILAVLLV